MIKLSHFKSQNRSIGRNKSKTPSQNKKKKIKKRKNLPKKEKVAHQVILIEFELNLFIYIS
jgi:hypothetical protein